MLTLKELTPEPIHIALGQSFSSQAAVIELIAMTAKASSLGHLCIPLEQLASDEAGPIKELIEQCPLEFLSFNDVSPASPLYFVENSLYLHKNFRAETIFLEEINRFHDSLHGQPEGIFEPDAELSEEQNQALEKALLPGMLLLTGGPGTGKTFTAKKIALALLQKSDFFKPTLILAAPTSKALDQLKKSIGLLASDIEVIADTMHKLVEFNSKQSAYLNASCIIIDEASMIEAPLMAKFFASLASEAKVILMGDPAQLPPVGLGSLFQDLLSLGPLFPYFHVAHLTKIHRCSDLSLITLAELSKSAPCSEFLEFIQKQHPSIQVIDQPLDPFHEAFLNPLIDFFENENFHLDHLNELTTHAVSSVILSTLRQGPLGVDAINQRLSNHFFTKSQSRRYFVEPVMLLETNRDLGLFNGEIGFKVYDRHNQQTTLFIKNKACSSTPSVKYTAAYALSVHKSQGSEYAKVLFMIPKGSEKFSREIVYTAVTRVKKMLWLWLDPLPLSLALTKNTKRYSSVLKRKIALK